MLPSPNLDDRTFEQIRDEAVRLIPQYCPEWTNFNPSDPGVTLIELFSWMTEMVLYRLNRVPDKVYLTLLDLIGVRLSPPQPSRVFLTFNLVEGHDAGVWVPRGTQVASEPNEDGESIVFETEEDVFVVPPRLSEVYSIHRDQVAHNTELLHTLPRQPFDAFAGTKEVDRYVYLGDERFSTLAETGTVQIVFDTPQARTEGITALLEWEYWNGHRWRELDTVPVPPEESAMTRNTERVVAFAGPLEDIAPGEVEGIEDYWIRGHLIELPANEVETIVGGVNAAAQILNEGIFAEQALACLSGDIFVPLDQSKTFYPFGEQPSLDTCLYLQCEECFAKEDARVFLDFVAADPTVIHEARPTDNLVLAVEYWNGRRWSELGRTTSQGVPADQSNDFSDTTEALTCTGLVSWIRPKDMSEVEVNGQDGSWYRIRILSGDYGRAGSYAVIDGNWVWKEDDPLRPPAFKLLTLRYSQVPYPIQRCLTYNDFRFVDRSEIVRDQFRTFQAFEPFREEHPALYLGFDIAFPEDQPVKMYVRVEEFQEDSTGVVLGEPFPEEASERERRSRRRKADQRVVWEFWNGERWLDLKPSDRTHNLTRSGLLEFQGPVGHVANREFGQELFWVRCRLEMGSYARSPKIEDLLINSVAGLNAVEVKQETLGHSDGTPDQRHAFARFPVLPGERILVREHEMPSKRDLKRILREEGEDAIHVETDEAGHPTEIWVRWHKVESYYASLASDRHYQIDPVAGNIVFGDGRRGMIPPPGPNVIRAESYMTGGGVIGNVGAGALTVLRQALPYVDRVTNFYAARGGADLESLDEAKLRGPQTIRHRYRAVTMEDYEWLALRASGNVARAHCLKTPRREGEVTVVVVPGAEQRELDLSRKPIPAPELLRCVQDFLDERRLVTTRVRVVKPRYVEISLRIAVVLKRGRGGTASERIKVQMERAVRTLLHPLFGGADGRGWTFGRSVHKSDIYRVVEELEGVDFVQDLELYDLDLKRSVHQLEVRDDELVHVVDLEVKEVATETLA